MSTNTTKKRGIRPPVPPKGGRQTKPKDPSPSAADTEPMASFLPFCAHCEKQIAVPNTTILYCSERCRKKDNQKMPPLNASTSCPTLANWTTTPPPLTPSNTGGGGGYFDLPLKNYVTPSSPTSPRSIPLASPDYVGSMSTSIRSTASGFNHIPSGLSSPIETSPSSPPTNYLSFYMPANARRPMNHMRTLTGSGVIPTTATAAAATTTTITTAAATAHTAFYNAYQRPLPPLHPRTYSSSPRSIELVTPIQLHPAPTSNPSSTTSGYSTAAELLYEKSYTIPESALRQNGTLKTMFNFDKIQGKVTGPAASGGFTKVTAVRTDLADGAVSGVIGGSTSKGDYGSESPTAATHLGNVVRMPNVMSVMRN